MLRLDAITLRQLRALRAIAEHKTFTAAAQALRQTTPAIHSQIKNLEAACGRELVSRAEGGAGMRLSDEGRELLRAAERIEAILSQAGARILAHSKGKTGHVTLSVVSTAKYFAPALVRDLQLLCPEITISLRVGNRQAVIADLELERCDLAVMGRPPRLLKIHTVPLGPHPHGIVARPDHPLAGQEGFDAVALLEEPFLSREEGSGTAILMQRYLRGLLEDQMPPVSGMDSNETIKQAVLAGLGLSFLSLHTVQEELRSQRLVTLRGQGLPVMRHWYLVYGTEVEPTGAAQRIAHEITAMNGRFLP